MRAIGLPVSGDNNTSTATGRHESPTGVHARYCIDLALRREYRRWLGRGASVIPKTGALTRLAEKSPSRGRPEYPRECFRWKGSIAPSDYQGETYVRNRVPAESGLPHRRSCVGGLCTDVAGPCCWSLRRLLCSVRRGKSAAGAGGCHTIVR